MVAPLSQTYIDMIKAFRDDCENLIDKFKKENVKNVRTFLDIWRSLHFNLAYEKTFSTQGIQHDFMRDSLQIAKLIMLRDDFSGGMFLMYGLYSLQNNPMGFIRLELDEFHCILRTLRLKDENQTKANKKELAFIFAKLLKNNAFDFVVFGREYDMEGQHRAQMIHNNQYDFDDDENPRSMRPKEWLNNFLTQMPKEVNSFENEYLKLKNKIKSVFPYLNLSLDMVEEDIKTTLLKALTQADCMAEPPEADYSIGARRRALKNRKMKTKHRYQKEEQEGLDPDESCTGEEITVGDLPSKPKKKKKGAPKGGRKLFFKHVINDPDLNPSSHSEDEEDKDSFVFNDKLLKRKLDLSNLL